MTSFATFDARTPGPKKLRLALCMLLVTTLLLVACGSDASEPVVTAEATAEPDPTAEPVEANPTAAPAADTSALMTTGVTAAQWSDNVTITMTDGSFRFESNGLPSHELPDQFLIPNDDNMPPFDGDDIEGEFSIQDTDELIIESPLDVEITLNPVYSDTVTETSLATIGVMISGAPLFNDYEDQNREFVALDDNLSLDGVFFIDSCSGHPLASGASYHYHGVPYCITDAVDVAGQHSTIIGVLLDGFGIYGPQDVGGTILANADLDECSGHVGPTPEYPEGIYHYHLTEDANPYSIDCFHGEIDYSGAGGPGGAPTDGGGADGGGPGGGGGPDLTEAAATLGVSVEALQGALGQPPFDFDAAAASLGVNAADLEAAVPGPPDGAPADGAPADGAPADGEDAGPPPDAPDEAAGDAAAPVDSADTATRSEVVMNAQWADNVTISIDGDTVRFTSDGLPSHEYLDVYLGDGRDGKFVAGGVDPYNASFSFPLVPTLASAPTETGNGAIGVAISGAVFFDPYEGNGSATVANDDNSTIDGIPFIDACGGHPLPNGQSYHYHGIPFCITDAVDTAGEHSELIGYLFDGFAIYGPQDVGGEEPTDLDACLGHVGPTPDFDEDTYHYHVSSQANYISECLAGVS